MTPPDPDIDNFINQVAANQETQLLVVAHSRVTRWVAIIATVVNAALLWHLHQEVKAVGAAAVAERATILGLLTKTMTAQQGVQEAEIVSAESELEALEKIIEPPPPGSIRYEPNAARDALKQARMAPEVVQAKRRAIVARRKAKERVDEAVESLVQSPDGGGK